jgi:hypothetical protein
MGPTLANSAAAGVVIRLATNSRLAVAWLGLMLFLLSADHLFVRLAGVKVKWAYLFILGLWLFDTAAMYQAARQALRRVPKYWALVLIPAAVAVATSVNVKSSLLWFGWLLFDALTVLTVYAFLTAHRVTAEHVQAAAAGALALMALFGLVQFVSMTALGIPIFDPQIHLGIYRLNGLSGWPHFLNIYAFLLLPIVLTSQRISVPVAVMLVVLFFVLAQSTAKTGWLLLGALALLLLAFHRTPLLRKAVLVAVPVVVIALLLPLPATPSDGASLSGVEKIYRFGRNFTETTSVRDRMLINSQGTKVWLKHPWFGVGPRAYDTYVFSRFDQELPGENKLDIEGKLNAKNENVWIEFLAESGVLFTLGFAALLIAALWVPRWQFANSLHLGSWMALVLYVAISSQVSQTGLLTMVYAVFGIYLYARTLRP